MARCEVSELEDYSCEHCLGHLPKLMPQLSPDGIGGFVTEEYGKEMAWEKHDYVETINDRERQVYPNPDRFTTDVDMSEIYGKHEAVRLTIRKVS